jgi:hypothetical protein
LIEKKDDELIESIPNQDSESLLLLLNKWVLQWVIPVRWSKYMEQGELSPTDDPIMEWCFAATENMCQATCHSLVNDGITFGDDECQPLYISRLL